MEHWSPHDYTGEEMTPASTPEFLADIAAQCKKHQAAGIPVVRTLADAYGVSGRAVRRWIGEAIKIGLLERPRSSSEDIAGVAIGPGRMAAFATAVLGLEQVRRSTVRHLLPDGTDVTSRTGKPRNNMSVEFARRLGEFEYRGWIKREGQLLRILDHDALWDYALEGCKEIPSQLLRVNEAIEEIRREQRSRRIAEVQELVDQRRRELDALARLMSSSPACWGRSGKPVRLINKPNLI